MSSRLPPLNALRFFEVAARHLSFRKAADELCVTPAAVSQQVRSLEEHLGVSLFSRCKGAIRLTEEGERCLPGIIEGFECIRQAVGRVQKSEEKSALVITAGPAFTSKWLIPRLHDFSLEHNNVDVRVVASLERKDLEAEGIDAAIRFGRPPEPAFNGVLLAQEAVVPMCSPKLLRSYASPEQMFKRGGPALIHDDSLRLVSKDAPTWETWAAAAGASEIDPDRGLRFNHADHALQSAISGAGMLLGRRILAEHDIRDGRLVVLRGPELETGLWFYLTFSDRARGRPIVKAFEQWLLAGMGHLASVASES